jgi:hypothetical protein
MAAAEEADARRRAEERRKKLLAEDERLAEMIRESEKSGELRAAPSWGKPMDLADGYARTPVELRMPFKILKEAGVVPPEVELMQRIGRLDEEAAAADPARAEALRRQAEELRIVLALRLERLRSTGSL